MWRVGQTRHVLQRLNRRCARGRGRTAFVRVSFPSNMTHLESSSSLVLFKTWIHTNKASSLRDIDAARSPTAS